MLFRYCCPLKSLNVLRIIANIQYLIVKFDWPRCISSKEWDSYYLTSDNGIHRIQMLGLYCSFDVCWSITRLFFLLRLDQKLRRNLFYSSLPIQLSSGELTKFLSSTFALNNKVCLTLIGMNKKNGLIQIQLTKSNPKIARREKCPVSCQLGLMSKGITFCSETFLQYVMLHFIAFSWQRKVSLYFHVKKDFIYLMWLWIMCFIQVKIK